ncbi:MAG: histidinol dehydrogenase, partial [Deinococcus sp.]|nr:histidinol dehydrogenase [Deinococcus sp.]
MIRIFPSVVAAQEILERRRYGTEASPALLASIQRVFGQALGVEEAVRRIVDDVRSWGDLAVEEWTKKADGVELERFNVPPEHWRAALESLDPKLRQALELAAERIASFHRRQVPQSWTHWDAEGALGQVIRPLRSVGVCVPGGTAPLFSTLLMSVIPAKVAGVRKVVVVTPPQRTGSVSAVILAAAALAGVDELYRIGGAQAVAALAYGTQSIPRVDKIVGPGNIFVTLAKRQVFGTVGIEGLYGPTETMVIADELADPMQAAADLLAQAEHDRL